MFRGPCINCYTVDDCGFMRWLMHGRDRNPGPDASAVAESQR